MAWRRGVFQLCRCSQRRAAGFQLPNVGEIAGSLVTRTLSVVSQRLRHWPVPTGNRTSFGKGLGKRSFFLELASLLVMAVAPDRTVGDCRENACSARSHGSAGRSGTNR